MELHRIVQEARRRKGLTQEELAERTRITVRTIQRIESGETAPRAFTLKTIAEALDLSLSDLLPPAPESAPSPEPLPLPGASPGTVATAVPDSGDDTHFLRLLCLSCFSCLFIPLVHFLVPLFIYRSRAKVLGPAARRFARNVVLGQVYWVIGLSLFLLLVLAFNLWQGREGRQLSYVAAALLGYTLNVVLIFGSVRQAGRLEASL
ncbi:MAG: XRE family transcriptional regulator [Chitinophagaceae bacterium]|nr:MAG: XRE family transcriptional regulator [Chitinophagaceae bacterium]